MNPTLWDKLGRVVTDIAIAGPLFAILYQTYTALPLQIRQLESGLLESRRTDLTSLADQLGDRLEKTEGFIRSIDRNFANLDGRVTGLTQAYTAQINERLAPLESSLSRIQQELSNLRVAVERQSRAPKENPPPEKPRKKP